MDDAVAQAVAQQYQDAEMRILARVTASLQKGLKANEFELVALGEAQALRADAIRELRRLGNPMAQQLAANVSRAYKDGTASAVADIGAALPVQNVASGQARSAVRRLAEEVNAGVGAATNAVLRQVDDAYRSVVARVVAATLTNGSTRQDAAQAAVDDLFGKGLPKFTDKGGRNWRLPDYVEMAVRTGNRQATIRGHEDVMDANELDLVVVQPGPRACPICDKWARSILSRSGYDGQREATSATTGKTMTLMVDATLAAARAAGYGHPNCRCRLRAFIPGATKLSTIERPPWDEKGYQAQQQQRKIERDIRAAKIRQATALNPEVAAAYGQSVKAQQALMRSHLAANPDLKRQSAREQVTGRFANPDERQQGVTRTPKPPTTPTTPELPTRPPEPEFLGQFTRGEARATKDVTRDTNPGQVIDENYRNNCHLVVGAVELRVRGYEVIAKPTVNVNGRYSPQIAADWVGKDGTAPEFTSVAKALKLRPSSAQAIDDLTAAWPTGARMFVSGAWRRLGGAHIFSAEKTDNGWEYHDGQVVNKDANTYLNMMTYQSVQIMRVDDLVPTERLLNSAEVASPERVAELKATATMQGIFDNDLQATKLRTEIAQATALLEALERDVAATEAASAAFKASTTDVYELRMNYEERLRQAHLKAYKTQGNSIRKARGQARTALKKRT